MQLQKLRFQGDEDGSENTAADDGDKTSALKRGNCIEPLRGAQVPQGPKV